MNATADYVPAQSEIGKKYVRNTITLNCTQIQGLRKRLDLQAVYQIFDLILRFKTGCSLSLNSGSALPIFTLTE